MIETLSAEDLPLLAWREKPLARRTDPVSSHSAADREQKAGRLSRRRRQVLEVVQANASPHTSKELAGTPEAVERGLDRYAIARRLPELEERGLVQSSRSDGHGGELLWWIPLAR